MTKANEEYIDKQRNPNIIPDVRKLGDEKL